MDKVIYERMHNNLLKLDLCHLETRIDGLLEDSSNSKKSIVEIIEGILDEEITFRESRIANTRIKLARFPFIKTIDQFEFIFQPNLDKERVLSLFSLNFIEEKGNVILIGPPGVGKTHIAISLGISACQHGYTTYWTTFQELIETLRIAHKQNRLKRKLQTFSKPKLLIIDEMGYLPLGIEESNFFFQLVSSRYLKGSIVLTSNRNFSEWVDIFPQESIAAAILDRLCENSKIIKIIGESYRIKSKKKLGLFEKT